MVNVNQAKGGVRRPVIHDSLKEITSSFAVVCPVFKQHFLKPAPGAARAETVPA